MAGEMRANVSFKDSMFQHHAVTFWGPDVRQCTSFLRRSLSSPRTHSRLPERLLRGGHTGSADPAMHEEWSLSKAKETDIISPCFRDAVSGTVSLQCVAKGML